MAGSNFGGTVKLTGESEYSRALKNITSELKTMGSQLKLATVEFENNGYKVGDLRAKNDALKSKLQEEQQAVKVCADAIKDFTSQQTKNKTEIDKLNSSLNEEKQKLDTMKNSTTATSTEISKQEKVVANLEKELVRSQTAYDSNNRKINDYTIKMNDAETECSKLSKEIKDNDDVLSKYGDSAKASAKTVKEFATEEDNAGSSTLKLGDLIKANLISEGIIAGIKGLAGAVKEVGKAFINLGTEAVKGYADFEQLEGGVKTLFGTEAGSVEEYAESVGKSVGEVEEEYNNLLTAQQQVFNDANNAYKDAGLSANEYMETVTSFSASLISSLDGDTVAAASASKQAIVDMADNANKMGTDISMIQNAYQGFAKQNYTMLDNLKLGYGGTKTEMERLIADANRVKEANGEMADLSIDSFADVTEAIHIIQDEMGITGTTSREASMTITGSISAMGSAWSNLVAGFANGEADLQGLISNLVDSVITALDNILPAVDQAVNSIMEAVPELLNHIIEHLPEFLEAGSNILNSLISGVQQNMPLIVEAVMQIISTLINTIIQNLPQILDMGIQLIVSLVQGIAQQLPTLIPQMINAVVSMVDTLLDNIDLIIDAGIQLILGLAEGLIDALPDLIDKIPEIIDKLIMAITNNLPKLIEAGITLTVKLAEGLIKAIPQLVSKIPQIITSLINGLANGLGKMLDMGKQLLGKVKDGITSGISGMLDIGKNLVQGLWNGINNAKDWVLDKIKGFGKSILNGIKSIFGIKSPSTVFRDEIGSNLAKGIGVGFEEEMSDVNTTIKNSLPTEFDLTTDVNVNKGINSNGINGSVGTFGGNNYETNNFNFYSTSDSPAEYARQVRKEMQYLKLVNG